MPRLRSKDLRFIHLHRTKNSISGKVRYASETVELRTYTARSTNRKKGKIHLKIYTVSILSGLEDYGNYTIRISGRPEAYNYHVLQVHRHLMIYK
jgi:hypothetical protein